MTFSPWNEDSAALADVSRTGRIQPSPPPFPSFSYRQRPTLVSLLLFMLSRNLFFCCSRTPMYGLSSSSWAFCLMLFLCDLYAVLVRTVSSVASTSFPHQTRRTTTRRWRAVRAHLSRPPQRSERASLFCFVFNRKFGTSVLSRTARAVLGFAGVQQGVAERAHLSVTGINPQLEVQCIRSVCTTRQQGANAVSCLIINSSVPTATWRAGFHMRDVSTCYLRGGACNSLRHRLVAAIGSSPTTQKRQQTRWQWTTKPSRR